jgi:hypothetical protein
MRWLFALGALAACEHPPSAQAAHFAVRGRLADPMGISYRIDPRDGPLDPELLRASIERAMEMWESTGVVAFEPAPPNGAAHVIFSWQRGLHGECAAFGTDTSLAHTGPVGPGTYVHFDSDRAWSENGGPDRHPLFQTALHELGHVLGLDHSADPAAVMYTGDAGERSRLTLSDRAGLASLYGGLEDGPGDLVLPGNEDVPALRRVAPARVSDCAIFDADGDGRDDVVVWRTDPEGHGMVMIYHFAPGPRLARTTGPLYGAVVPGAPVFGGTTAAGERVLLSVLQDGAYLARRFDASALLGPWPEGQPLVLPEQVSDTDGDGMVDAPPREHAQRHGDLDGNGRVEELRRIE